MKKKKQSKPDRPKVQPLDPCEAADRFMKEATHDWQTPLRELVWLALEAAAKQKEGEAADKQTD